MNKFARIVRKNKGAVALASLVGGVPAFAAGPDFSTLTAAVDFGTVVTAVLAIAALMIIPKVAGWGAKKVLGFIRG
ncbi:MULTISPECIES: hypothetical protein [unclassified Variovorax]|uniref:hypothetical protein n=1 Tax=unclassified Variovorax TaxID=663243 RepID=UPI000F7E18F5|nr:MULTISPECIES: hypothetical protein [unclassified Variovorax]RSZ35057.1 hypothetical protein EJO70_24585 [Variovorax sp. 553]RSZ35925.1 hypothetical protein EJO71_25905 [Variovorax sp. 679]